MAKNNVYNGNNENFGNGEKVPEIWDPNFKVSTWDHSILGIYYAIVVKLLQEECLTNLISTHVQSGHACSYRSTNMSSSTNRDFAS